MDFSRLLSLREDNDLIQVEMGKIIGVKRYSISNWENGREIIPLKYLNIYANYFHVSMDYLLRFSNDKNNNRNNIELDKKIIGNRLKDIRIKHNLTQRELAKILNTTHSTIGGYENGKNLILTTFAYQICIEFNISMDYLCGRVKEPNSLVKS